MRIRFVAKNCKECPVRYICFTNRSSVLPWTPQSDERVIDITCDVWGGAGPDCCMQPS